MPIKIEIKEINPEAAILSLSGKLNIESVLQFDDIAQPLINSREELFINCENIYFIDSSGIGALIKLMNCAKNSETIMVIYNLKPDIEKMFTVAHLDKFFTTKNIQELKQEYPSYPFK